MDRIEVSPALCSGNPVIRGTRIMVRNILGMIAGGYTVESIVTSYPELGREDVIAAIEYSHAGVVRLRVWPTTIENTKTALARLFDLVAEEDLQGSRDHQ